MRKIEKILKETTNRRVYHILRCVDQDPYPEDYGHYEHRNPGRRGWRKFRLIWKWERRMYRTWKHTRKFQWK